MNLIFLSGATLLLVCVALWLGRVLWRGPTSDSDVEHHAVNATVLRDQLAELEQDFANGILSSRDFADAKQELQRRALHEAEPNTNLSQKSLGGKRAAVALIIVLPLATALTYYSLGNPAATLPTPVQSAPAMTQADVQAMVNGLEARLASNPDDPAGWLMLARSYRYFGKYENAATAFDKASPIVQADPLALTEYAETLARINQMGFKGEPTQLLERALTLNPREPFALTLAGAAALERRDYQSAINHWQQLLEQLPVDSNAAQAVANTIEQIQQEKASVMTP
ncbi:c-type cytochrome biogenesis protein CcmI [Pollutimonas subterranea]|uniref:C-type cytochrome biogenesis protein CcmI n=1 Tax=Pollutimonas subterranea TaxID=2045210 RepID=A0A2N4U752_9BURK|nr:c-type cytochrome biogenesis protein CcmI [Pollutimonas subterranea]PLC50850.1 c-type cytochrome biogenesis protein CcmI [Pollutimonas subterranea]